MQLLLLEPSLIILDETDSGLDIDALKVVSEGINSVLEDSACLVITHYQRLLDYVKPNYVHAMIAGGFVKSGGPELAHKLEANGYDWLEPKSGGEDMTQDDVIGDYKYGFHDSENATIRFDKGLSEQVVRDISALKDEPEWMTEIRLKAYKHFIERPMPDWGNTGMLKSMILKQ